MQFDLTRRLAAEALGTLILVMAVVGSGIMAEKLAGGNQALALLCNTIATGAVLFVIITIFAPVSGAHFNPAVSLVMRFAASSICRTHLRLCRRADRWRLRRRRARASDVRARSDPARLDGAHRARPMGRRVHRHVRADRDHSRLRALQARGGRDRGRPLHHLSLLVHCLDLVRQPCGDHCAEFEQHVRRDRAARCAGLYRGRAVRRVRRRVSVRLAVRCALSVKTAK